MTSHDVVVALAFFALGVGLTAVVVVAWAGRQDRKQEGTGL